MCKVSSNFTPMTNFLYYKNYPCQIMKIKPEKDIKSVLGNLHNDDEGTGLDHITIKTIIEKVEGSNSNNSKNK